MTPAPAAGPGTGLAAPPRPIYGRAGRAPLHARAVFEAVRNAARRCGPADVALSGGLDSSVIAWCVRERDPVGYTLRIGGAPDAGFAREAARHLGIRHVVIEADGSGLLEAARETVGVLGSFNDIEIRNMAAMRLLFSGARRRGASAMLTGDGADEVFAGYGFLRRMPPERLPSELRRLAENMRFSSGRMAESAGLAACAPFMDPEVARTASKIPPGLLVGRGEGKAVLRAAFEGALPDRILRREKLPMQDGAGTSAIAGMLESEISGREFSDGVLEAAGEGVRIRSRESLYYYQEFRRRGLEYARAEGGCPDCGHPASRFCRMCGRFPV